MHCSLICYINNNTSNIEPIRLKGVRGHKYIQSTHTFHFFGYTNFFFKATTQTYHHLFLYSLAQVGLGPLVVCVKNGVMVVLSLMLAVDCVDP